MLPVCCNQARVFSQRDLYCNGEHETCVIIRQGQPYYQHSGADDAESDDSTDCEDDSSDGDIYCVECFNNFPDESKSEFQLLNNDAEYDAEPVVQCRMCGELWHSVCALYNRKIHLSFACEKCYQDLPSWLQIKNKYTAEGLPQCQLSRHIENRVQKFLKKNIDSSEKAPEVLIRVLFNSDKQFSYLPNMHKKYSEEDGRLSDRIPYRHKAVFAFTSIDNADVCFFGMHVQEYDSSNNVSETSDPNSRWLNIAYLDSVAWFQPRHLRSDVYHEILLGYLDFAKSIGYTMAHIWACPTATTTESDYIFYYHPKEQKMPEIERLKPWYEAVFDKGKKEGIIFNYQLDFYNKLLENGLISDLKLLPYFKGDCLPVFIEECIREENTFERLLQKLNNEIIFVVQLYSLSQEKAIKTTPIRDPDPPIISEMMANRESFFRRACTANWEFSSLRRAKWSTMNMCYTLHMEKKDRATGVRGFGYGYCSIL